jgi:hypothetical protein
MHLDSAVYKKPKPSWTKINMDFLCLDNRQGSGRCLVNLSSLLEYTHPDNLNLLKLFVA